MDSGYPEKRKNIHIFHQSVMKHLAIKMDGRIVRGRFGFIIIPCVDLLVFGSIYFSRKKKGNQKEQK